MVAALKPTGVARMTSKHAKPTTVLVVEDEHRARGTLRELRPPDYDPLDAALGRSRRGAGADRDRHRVQPDGAARPDPADRHRQEECDHDDRFRARRRAKTMPELARCGLSSLPQAIPADHHDDGGGDARRVAAGDRIWGRRRTAPPARH